MVNDAKNLRILLPSSTKNVVRMAFPMTPPRVIHSSSPQPSEAAEQTLPPPPPTAELVSLLYDELRAIAVSLFRRQPDRHTLQPTAVVHEVFVKLCKESPDEKSPWKGRGHFLGVAAMAMRQVLVDHARAKGTQKRSAARRVSIESIDASVVAPTLDVLVLHEAIERFSIIDPRAAKLVVLRFFAGLTVQEAAQVLGISDWTAEQDWRGARAWLGRELGPPT